MRAGGITRIVVAGHVDHGKSTLVGRLLCDTGQIPCDRKEKVRRICEKTGRRFEFAFLLDAFEEEQKQGITIDSSEIGWRFKGRTFIFIDTPGHKELLKNMVTGASRADAAILLLDASEGIRDQFRRHSYILKMLGLAKVIVAVNKMDVVSYSAGVYKKVDSEVRDFFKKNGISPVAVVPLCALNGDNVFEKSAKMKWYKGGTLCEAVYGSCSGAAAPAGPLRFSVQDVYKAGEKRICAGRVESGVLKAGQKIRFSPSGETTVVRSIEKWNEPARSRAREGESIGITLSDPVLVERGAVGSAMERPPNVSDLLHANIFWMGDLPMSAGKVYSLKLAAQEVNCRIDSIEKVINASTFEEIKSAGNSVAKNDVGSIVIKLEKPLAFDEFSGNAPMGRFVVADGGRVCGGGIVVKDSLRRAPVSEKRRTGRVFLEKSRVTGEEREKRNSHRAFVIWLTGLSGAGKSTVAKELEKALFTNNAQVFFLDGDNIRSGINRDLGFSSQDRLENIRRVGEIARLFADAGIITVTAFISPYGEDREMARKIIGPARFIEVFLDCPLEVCAGRDLKGLYKKARKGEILNFTGVNAPYEKPKNPDITIRTDKMTVKESVDEILEYLRARKGIAQAGRLPEPARPGAARRGIAETFFRKGPA